MNLADRLTRFETSITLALDARAKALRADGKDVVNLTVGEPDFAAPEIVRRAAIARIESGDVRYTPAAGLESLRAAVAERLAATRGGAWSSRNVTVCHSTKHALYSALVAVVDDGDEVLVPTPAWSSYFDQVRLAGGEPVGVPCAVDARGFHPDVDALRAAVTPRTRALMINSPNNPTGSVWNADEIASVAAFAVEHDVWLLSDEIYRELVYDGGEAPSPASVSDEARARTIVLDGASKAYAMTGYRIGFVAGPPEVAAAVAKITSQTNGSANTIGQAAFEAALRETPPELASMRASFAERRVHLLKGLADLGLETPEPRGAFYAFPNVSKYLDDRGSVGFCEDLLERELVALVPGSAFGSEGHVRLSYAASTATLDEALARLGRFLA